MLNKKIVSYAQNFEDVMLWRVFKNIKNGTYMMLALTILCKIIQQKFL